LSCALCETRKEKRFCPAVHGRICPQCCGTEREVTLDCPSDCVYLQQARQHDRPRNPEEMDQASLLPEVRIPEEFLYEREPLIRGFSFAVAKFGQHDRTLRDRDVIAALTGVARKYQTLVSSGLIYDGGSPLAQQQLLADEIQKLVAGFRELEQKNLGYFTLKDVEVLYALVFLLRLAASRTSGRPRSRAFLDFLEQQFPQKEPLIASPAESASRIIVP
jgi:hypothetical protein